jgi:CDP-diacylglycerol---glycerol-3-phosphate 3-phosphatidyltransferase
MAIPRNLPNWITGSRLVLAGVVFTLLWLIGTGQDAGANPGGLAAFARGHERLLFNVSLAIFTLAGISDVLDGYVARRWGLQTDFGRIVDPFADKVIVCGTFVLLIPLEGSQVAAWMVVLILARELLVDGLRGFAESRGIAFPASTSGKAKMFFQSISLLWVLYALGNQQGVAWAESVGLVLLWLAVIATLASGLTYLIRARTLLREHALAGAAE